MEVFGTSGGDREAEVKIEYESYSYYIKNILLKEALKVGVDYDLFWKLNPKSLQPFLKHIKRNIKTI